MFNVYRPNALIDLPDITYIENL